MPSQTHPTSAPTVVQLSQLTGDAWARDLVPRLPADLALQARTHKAFQRRRGLLQSTDLLRGLLAYVLGAMSFRRLGAWAVLIGLADISDTAWRKRLLRASAWLLWLLGALLAGPPAPAWLPASRRQRILLIDATKLAQPGGTGDDWRLHTAYALEAGRMAQVRVTDRHTGEHLGHFALQPGDIVVADNGYGYRRSVATASQQQAAVVLRITPATFPLETAAGTPFRVFPWLRRRGPAVRCVTVWCQWARQHYEVRLIAARLPPEAVRAARQRRRRRAQKHSRQVQATTLYLAAWVLLITTLEATTWTETDVLRLYRARWQVELVYKRMKQVLRLNQLRSTQAASAEATVRALLVAWALQEDEAAQVRALLAALTTIPAQVPAQAVAVVSSWLLTSLCLDTLRQQVHGTWSATRLRTCLPRLRRFLIASPRQRIHQETDVRTWLASKAIVQQPPQCRVA
jgi:hypothetical protein